ILLDHEVIHYGDPGFDLGFALTHLLSKAHHLEPSRAQFRDAAAQFWDRYRRGLGDVRWGDAIEPRAVRHLLGCMLARVAGRSPLQYLSRADGEAQRRAVVSLMQRPPDTVEGVIDSFLERVRQSCP